MSKFGAGVEAVAFDQQDGGRCSAATALAGRYRPSSVSTGRNRHARQPVDPQDVNPADDVPQSPTPQRVEPASEFGLPKSIRSDAPYLKVGYTQLDYDLMSALTKFLRSACAEQVRAALTRMMESERHTIQAVIFEKLFATQPRATSGSTPSTRRTTARARRQQAAELDGQQYLSPIRCSTGVSNLVAGQPFCVFDVFDAAPGMNGYVAGCLSHRNAAQRRVVNACCDHEIPSQQRGADSHSITDECRGEERRDTTCQHGVGSCR